MLIIFFYVCMICACIHIPLCRCATDTPVKTHHTPEEELTKCFNTMDKGYDAETRVTIERILVQYPHILSAVKDKSIENNNLPGAAWAQHYERVMNTNRFQERWHDRVYGAIAGGAIGVGCMWIIANWLAQAVSLNGGSSSTVKI